MGEKKRRLAQGGTPATPAQADPGPGVEALLAESRARLSRGDASGAFACAQRALAAAPGRHDALFQLGQCCLAAGQRDMGLGLLQKAAQASAEPHYRAEWGRALAAAGRLHEAVAPLRTAADTQPDAQVARDLGAVLLHLGRREEARVAYAQAAALAPDRADLHEALARLDYASGEIAAACAGFARARALAPDLIERLNIGFARAGTDAVPTGDAPGPLAPGALPAVAPWRLVRSPAQRDAGADASTPALRAACEARALCIIDDLLDDPLAYRDRALSLHFPHNASRAGINYPGSQSAAQPSQPIMQRLAAALGRDLKWDSPDNGAFRYSPAAAAARNDIHVDSPDRDDIYAAVLYLSLPAHCRGGTVFWRHRATGWERRPTAAALAAQGYASLAQFERRWMPVDRLRPFADLQKERDAAWEAVLEVPMRFNRLVAYRSDFFHSIGELFGDQPANARFVQLFFFEAA